MSFTVNLQRNMSESIAMYKDITDILTVSGTLRDSTSIIDPVLLIECDITDLVQCNYMYIPTFRRQYFIQNIKSIRNNLVEVTAHVDALSSWAAYIAGNRGIVKRQQNVWNLYVDDGSFKTYQNPNVLTKAFPSGFTTQEFVLAVAGN